MRSGYTRVTSDTACLYVCFATLSEQDCARAARTEASAFAMSKRRLDWSASDMESSPAGPTSESKRVKRFRWDEANIAYCEATKSATMKVRTPPAMHRWRDAAGEGL